MLYEVITGQGPAPLAPREIGVRLRPDLVRLAGLPQGQGRRQGARQADRNDEGRNNFV